MEPLRDRTLWICQGVFAPGNLSVADTQCKPVREPFQRVGFGREDWTMDTGFPDDQEGKQSQQGYWDLNKVSDEEAVSMGSHSSKSNRLGCISGGYDASALRPKVGYFWGVRLSGI